MKKLYSSLLLSFGLTILIIAAGIFSFLYVRHSLQSEAKIYALNKSSDITNLIKSRFNRDTYLLNGVKGLFAASKSVERNEFNTYGSTMDLAKNYPGIYAVSFVAKVASTSLDDFIIGVKNDTSINPNGYPDFHIYSATSSPEYFIAKYVYPEPENIKVLGYNFFSEPTRLVAAERARDENMEIISGKINILPNNDPGFLLVSPVFVNNQPTNTVEERRNNLDGFVTAAFKVNQFFTNLLQNEPIDLTKFEFDVYDISNNKILSKDNLIFSMNENGKRIRQDSDNIIDIPLNLPGRQWIIKFRAASDYGLSPLEKLLPWLFLFLFVLLSIFIFVSFYFLSSSRRRAVNIAERMNKEIKEKEEKFRTIVNNVDVGIYRNTLNDGGTFLEANPAMWKIFGFESKEDFMKCKASQFYPSEEDRQPITKELRDKGFVNDAKIKLKKKDGKIIWVTLTARAHRDEKGQIDWIDGVMEDITEEKKLAEKERIHADEIERMNKLMVGRELKMVDLKKEINKLKEQQDV